MEIKTEQKEDGEEIPEEFRKIDEAEAAKEGTEDTEKVKRNRNGSLFKGMKFFVNTEVFNFWP